LFGHPKNRFKGQQLKAADKDLSGIREILDEISIDTLEVVFRE
jgi:hypothetical protein